MTGHHLCPRCGAERPYSEEKCGFCGSPLPEVRLPSPDDVRCQNPNCLEWYHRALKACPMCDTPRRAPVLRQPDAPVVGPIASPPVTIFPANNTGSSKPPFAALGVGFLVLSFLVGPCLSKKPSETLQKKAEAHAMVVSALSSNNDTYVRPFDPELPKVQIVVPVDTSERVAQEIALEARKALHRVDALMTVRVETPAGQILAERSGVFRL